MSAASAVARAMPAPTQPDLTAVKTRQQGAWSSGDYAVVGTTLQIVGETAVRGARPARWTEGARCRRRQRQCHAGGRAPLVRGRLDRLCAGAARTRPRSARPPSGLTIDIPGGRCRSAAVRRRSFDVVVSTFGVMFTADQDKAAAELLRVCKPGGKIGLANWTPDGFIGQVFKTIGKHMPPPAGVKSPALWGTRARITEMFGAQAPRSASSSASSCSATARPQHWLDVFKTYYGPVLKTFGALDPKAQAALTEDLFALIERFNRSGDATMVVPSDYLEVVVTRRA